MSHTDKGFYSNSSVPKKDWERIFGKHKPSDEPEQLRERKPKPRVNRNDFLNKHVRWV